MKKVILMLASSLLIFATATFSQEVIPPGTVIPIQLNSSFSLNSKPGQVLTARVMQDVPLSTGATIRAGARMRGRVLNVTPLGSGTDAQISFVFDKLVLSKRIVPLSTDLRAIASFVEVDEAQIPETGADRGTPENARTTVQVGGDIDYRGGGPVTEGSRIVGKPTFQGVLSQVASKTGTTCRGAFDGNDGPQALWVFSSDACGAYGFPGVIVAHAGRSSPLGQITLATRHGHLNVSGGTGMLLRVTGTNPNDAMNNNG
jgi:hypothetical protein